MLRFETRGWLTGIVAGCGALLPMACSPADELPVEELPALSTQVQGAFGGDLGSRVGFGVARGVSSGVSEFTPQCAPLQFRLNVLNEPTAVSVGSMNQFAFNTDGSESLEDLFSLKIDYEPL